MAADTTYHMAWKERVSIEDSLQRRLARSFFGQHTPLASNKSRANNFMLQYPSGTSDPNQMRAKDFVDGRKPNYYLIRSALDYSFSPTNPLQKSFDKSDYGDTKSNTSCLQTKIDVPKVHYHRRKRAEFSTRPKTTCSQRVKKLNVWERSNKKYRFNEPLNKSISPAKPQQAFKPAVKYEEKPNECQNRSIKEKIMITEIIKGLKTLNEEELDGVRTYIKSIRDSKDETKQGDTLNAKNLKKLDTYSAYQEPNEGDARSCISGKTYGTAYSKISGITNISTYVTKLEQQIKDEKKERGKLADQVTHLTNVIKSLRPLNTISQ